jgi:hypothetical protein
LSVASVFSIILLAWYFNSTGLPTSTDYEEYFRVFNICTLGYVTIKSSESIILKQRKEFSYPILGYSILWMGQVSLLFFSLYGKSSYVIGAFLLKDIGLVVFIRFIYNLDIKSKLKII